MERKAKAQVVGDKVSPAARHTGVSTVASQKGMEIKGQGKNSPVYEYGTSISECSTMRKTC